MFMQFFTLLLGFLCSMTALIPAQVAQAARVLHMEDSSKEVFGKQAKQAIHMQQLQKEAGAKQENFTIEFPKKISALRMVVEKNFNDQNQFTGFFPIISKDDLEATVKTYLASWGITEQEADADLFVEKNFIGMKKTLVIGDLHGAIFSLLDLFDDWKARGWLDDDYTLVPNVQVQFLGDYVDRGQGGLEILFALVLLKLKNPSQVTLGRGNHEEKEMNTSFAEELNKKYKSGWRECFNLITLIYNTFPVTTVLAGGKSCEQGDLSYYLCHHGTLDEPLAASLDEILAKKFSATAEPLFFCNSPSKMFVSKEVMWGDSCQASDPSNIDAEKPLRDRCEKTGRPRSNQKWREAQLEPLLKKGYMLKGEVRAHQHAISCGVVLDSETMQSLCKIAFSTLDPQVNQNFEKLAGPYGEKGPYPVEGAQKLLEYFYKTYRSHNSSEHWKSWIDGLGNVPQFTISAAYGVPDIPGITEVSYLVLTPGATPKIPWGIQKISIERFGGEAEGSVSRIFDIQEPPALSAAAILNAAMRNQTTSGVRDQESASTSAALLAQAPADGSSSTVTSQQASSVLS